ncbi:exosortase/archaeosortase family protein [uncultured Desulfosarcina sp.]|uniref:exosortase/archaeosortase family protein n=1 Tax=uncultured Desulfosarcina sp. TaxID=218289 RepID=UPI0029C73499|nr:exosortase/archaeosortase family protein [uncultured Desulfosarcina sp.]
MRISTDIIKRKSTLLALIALTLFVAGYAPIFEILGKVWLESDEYAHALLVLPIIGYMVWTQRAALVDNPVRFSSIGLLILAVSTPLFMFALLTQVRTVIALSMLMTVIGTIIYLAGVGAVKVLFTPLILLAMLIPVPEQLYIQLTFPLQLKVSQISEVVIRLLGVPIFREGNVMTIPQKTFEVVEACSGLRSMIALLTLSVIMGYFILRRPVSKMVLVAASVPTAILVNIIRVVSMILLFHFFKLDLTEGTLHTVMGLAIFTIALLILFLLQKALELWETRSNLS